jgi:hypothetical protein
VAWLVKVRASKKAMASSTAVLTFRLVERRYCALPMASVVFLSARRFEFVDDDRLIPSTIQTASPFFTLGTIRTTFVDRLAANPVILNQICTLLFENLPLFKYRCRKRSRIEL